MVARSFKWRSVACVVGLGLGVGMFGTGCPAKDHQELMPLDKLKAEEHAEAAGTTEKIHTGVNEAETPSEQEEEAPGWTAYSTGVPAWREPSGGRPTGLEMTFGAGHSGAAPERWAFNTDSTGAVGDKLGTGVSYGSATGTLMVNPGTPATRPDNYPALQVAPQANLPKKAVPFNTPWHGLGHPLDP